MADDKDKIDKFLENDQTPEEKKTETPAKEEEPIKDEEPIEVDTDALREDITKEVTDKLVKSLVGKTEEDIVEQSPWEKEKRNPHDYREIADWSKDQAKKEMRAELTEAEKAKQDEADKETERQKQSAEQWNKFWDKQLDELRADGELPPIKNKEDPNDEGVKAEKELFELAYSQGKNDLEAVYYKTKVKGTGKQPAGANAPISAGKKSVQEDKGDYSYEDIHNKSTEDIARGE